MLLRGLRGTIRTSALAKVDKTCGSAPTAEHWIIHWEMVNVIHHKPGSQSVAGGRSKSTPSDYLEVRKQKHCVHGQ